MRRTRPSFSRRNEHGSTILEMLVAIFILSGLSVGVWRVVGASLRLAGRVQESVLAGARLIQLDDTVRGLSARVLPPFWAPEDFVLTGHGVLRAAFLDGDPARSLVVSFGDGTLSVGDGTRESKFPGFRTVTFSVALDRENHAYGIVLEAEGNEGRSTVITSRFGGSSIRSGRAP